MSRPRMVAAGATMTPRTPPDDHRAATEVPRTSGHPPSCPVMALSMAKRVVLYVSTTFQTLTSAGHPSASVALSHDDYGYDTALLPVPPRGRCSRMASSDAW